MVNDTGTRGGPGQEQPESAAELRAAIDALTDANRAAPDRDTERRLLWLRHLAGIDLVETQQRLAVERPPARYPEPADEHLLGGTLLPEVEAADVTPGLVRAAILRSGCLIVRGLVDRAEAERFAGQIDRAYEERERKHSGGQAAAGYYEEFKPKPPFQQPNRGWVKKGGGLPAADSPMLSFERMEMLTAAGIPELVSGYLGEPAAFSVQKTTFRRVEPSVVGAWHQDGSFMGRVHSINLWISLSRCGDVAPGLDIVPRRIDHLVARGTDGTYLENQISQAAAEEAAGDLPIVRPIFEPGDAVLFDELCLHQTASDPSMREARFAIESWFFAPSAMPARYAPLAV